MSSHVEIASYHRLIRFKASISSFSGEINQASKAPCGRRRRLNFIVIKMHVGSLFYESQTRTNERKKSSQGTKNKTKNDQI